MSALVGTLIGVALGVVLALANTSGNRFDSGHPLDPIVRVPWSHLGGVVFVVPLIAAAIVALSVRRSPTVIRRQSVGG